MTVLTRRILPDARKAVRAELKLMTNRVVARQDDLNLGDRGAAIKALQHHLRAAGLYRGALSGEFTPATEAAVRSLQQQKGLPVTGQVDDVTLRAVRGLDLFVKPGLRTPARINQTGGDVKRLEQRLHALGYKTGKVDGVFDAKTKHAVEVFQRRHDLKPSGVAGHGTAVKVDKALEHKRDQQFRHRVLDIARDRLGFHEGRNNSNPFSRFFGRDHEPWCADFVSYCYSKAGRKLNEPWTPALLSKLKANGTFTKSHPRPGDVVMFDWHPGSGRAAEHTGLVEKVFKRNGTWYVRTIEGNSSDRVKRNVWPVHSSVIAGFGTIR